MTLNQWITRFLAKRALTKPDGRPLFAYKASHDEYLELGEKLRGLTEKERTTTELRYAQAWLLFAAEWWKREYAGGAWSWAKLCSASGLNDTPQPVIQSLVMSGREYWNLREEIKNRGKRFIGFVAINGGIPMRLIETAQGSLAKLLQTITEQSIRYNLSQNEIWQSIELRANNALPTAYQQESIYELLTLLVQKIINLRKKYKLSDNDDPIGLLQAQHPNWINEFPLTMDSNAASTLITGLICEANRIDDNKNCILFKLTRNLRFASDSSTPNYELNFSIQAQASRQQLADALSISYDKLPPNIQLLLRVDDTEYPIAEATRNGENYQLIAKKSPTLNSLYASVRLIASCWGNALSVTNLPGGEALNQDEPLIFEDSYPIARFLAQGDAVLKGRSALVLYPSQAIVFSDTAYTEVFSDSFRKISLIRIAEGETRLSYKRQVALIDLHPVKNTFQEAHWTGYMFNEISSSTPGLLFRGAPRLRIEQDGVYSDIPSNELYTNSTQSKTDIQLNRTDFPCMCRLIWKNEKHRFLSTMAVILPEDASIKYISGNTPFEGEIHLIKWGDINIACETEYVSLTHTFDHSRNILKIKLKCDTRNIIHSIKLRLQWPNNKEQKITLPFPGHGVVLKNNEQEVISSNKTLTLSELTGCHALLMPANDAEKWTIRLSINPRSSSIKLSQDINYYAAREIRLFELIPIIRQMLSSDPTPDGKVKMEIINSHQTKECIYIGNYSTEIKSTTINRTVCINDGVKDIYLDQEIADGLLRALPLTKPENGSVKLPLHFSENTFTGDWLIDLPAAIKGPWLIYATASSKIQSRPTIIKSSLVLPSNMTPLRKALCEQSSELRMSCLRHTLQEMTKNIEHEDWLTLESITNELKNLALPSLDIFLALASEPETLAIATLFLENFANTMTEKFPSELPFEWLLISPRQWWNAFEFIKNQSSEKSLIQQSINRKTKYLSHWQPALVFIFEQGLQKHFGIKNKDAELFSTCPELFINKNLDKLFGSSHRNDKSRENSCLQKMLRRNVDQQYDWPDRKKLNYSKFLNTKLGKVLVDRSGIPIDDLKIPAIILPFIVAFDAYEDRASEWQNNPSSLFTLRQARQLDREWFDEAYCVGLAMAQHHKKHSSGAQ